MRHSLDMFSKMYISCCFWRLLEGNISCGFKIMLRYINWKSTKTKNNLPCSTYAWTNYKWKDILPFGCLLVIVDWPLDFMKSWIIFISFVRHFRYRKIGLPRHDWRKRYLEIWNVILVLQSIKFQTVCFW